MLKKVFGALCVCFILVLIGSSYQKYQLNKKIIQITKKYEGVKTAYLICQDNVDSFQKEIKSIDNAAEKAWDLSVKLQKENDDCKRSFIYLYRLYSVCKAQAGR